MTTQTDKIKQFGNTYGLRDKKESWLSNLIHEIDSWIEPLIVFRPIEILGDKKITGLSVEDIKAIEALKAR